MIYEQSFLDELTRHSPIVQHISITVLTWDELTIQTVQGYATGGSVKIDGNSKIRRSASLTFVPDKSLLNIKDIQNLLYLNKKVKLAIGIENKCNSKYEDIIWFPMGIFVISDVSLSAAVGNTSISVTLQDKMTLLNGIGGGVIPAETTLLYTQIQDYFRVHHAATPTVGTVHSKELTIKQLIYYVVRFFGKEKAENIILLDLDENDYQRQVLRVNDDAVDCVADVFGIDGSWASEVSGISFIKNECVGYGLQDLIMPETELILKPGEFVTTLLDRILTVLGNYECFYDTSGHFIFREKRNFHNTQLDPLSNLGDSDYFRVSFDDKYYYSLNDLSKVNSLHFSPNYMNIKNYYSFWGKNHIHYVVFLDEKPQLILAKKYLYVEMVEGEEVYSVSDEALNLPLDSEKRLEALPCGDWREELYRRKVVAGDNPYFLTFNSWRDIYRWSGDSMKYNTEVLEKHAETEWFDIITSMSQFSIANIGMRGCSETHEESTILFNYYIPEKVFIDEQQFFDDLQANLAYNFEISAERRLELENPDWRANWSLEEIQVHSGYWSRSRKLGYDFYIVKNEEWSKFQIGYLNNSLFLNIQNALYQHLSFNAPLSISALPSYYLEPNNLLYIKDTQHSIVGEFIIQSLNYNLKPDSLMQIEAFENVSKL